MDRPVLSCRGAPGVADLAEHGTKQGEFGVEKRSLKPELVDGCGRSDYRVVGPVVSKTLVFQSKESKKSKKS